MEEIVLKMSLTVKKTLVFMLVGVERSAKGDHKVVDISRNVRVC